MPTPAFTLPSPQTGTEYWIYVEGPKPEDEAAPLPIVLCMDGDDQFGTARTAYRGALAARKVRPLLLVGVGYGASYRRPQNKRIRDYTPTPLATEAESGQITPFLAFLTETLLPELARRHRVHANLRGIAGHSLGALVALHALIQPHPVFTHFLASAPSLWWHDRSPLRLIAERYRLSPNLRGKLFLSVGLDDTESMIGDLALLEQQLVTQPFEGLTMNIRRLPRRNHYNALPDAFREGLSDLFGAD